MKNALGHEIPDPNMSRADQLRLAEGQESVFTPEEVKALRIYVAEQMRAAKA
jgi:hypothetical protein